jgi:hypothetical protein
MNNFGSLFGSEKAESNKGEDVDVQQLYARIGKLEIQNDFLKKKLSL